jgi:hypothetical protein
MAVRTPTLEEMAAKQAITEVIHRFSRGVDRMDEALTRGCWHPGGTDEHAPFFAGTAEEFVAWVWPIHGKLISTRHVVSNILIDLRGDEAGAESYYMVISRAQRGDELVDSISGGRYLDRLRCIDGEWAFTHRQIVRDWFRTDVVNQGNNPTVPPRPDGPVVAVSARDRSDASYDMIGDLIGRLA